MTISISAAALAWWVGYNGWSLNTKKSLSAAYSKRALSRTPDVPPPI